MTKKTENYIVRGSIVLFSILYMLGYAWLITPHKEPTKTTKKNTLLQRDAVQRAEKRQPKSLPAGRPEDLNHDNLIDEASYYQDHYDEYQDDPEDELRFPPEIFDANDD